MKYKVGDAVVVKDAVQYDAYKRADSSVAQSMYGLVPQMVKYCGKMTTVKKCDECIKVYYLDDCEDWWFIDDMVVSLEEFIRSVDYPKKDIPKLCTNARKIITDGGCSDIECGDCPASGRYFPENGSCDMLTGTGGMDDVDNTFFEEFLRQFDKSVNTNTNADMIARIDALEARIAELERVRVLTPQGITITYTV